MPSISGFQPWSDILSQYALSQPAEPDPAQKVAAAMQGWAPQMQERARTVQNAFTNRPFNPDAFAQRMVSRGVSPLAFAGNGKGGEGAQGPRGFSGEGSNPFGGGFSMGGWGGGLGGLIGGGLGSLLGPAGTIVGGLLGRAIGGSIGGKKGGGVGTNVGGGIGGKVGGKPGGSTVGGIGDKGVH